LVLDSSDLCRWILNVKLYSPCFGVCLSGKVECALFGSYVDSLQKMMGKVVEGLPVVVVQFAKIKIFRGINFLSCLRVYLHFVIYGWSLSVHMQRGNLSRILWTQLKFGWILTLKKLWNLEKGLFDVWFFFFYFVTLAFYNYVF